MKVPFSLRKLSAAGPATALLLPKADAGQVLDVCARLGTDPLPRVYRLADGFLLQLAAPTAAAVPGAVRLRGLADNLLLPVDAALVPPLLEDEAAALVRRRGLVFLPGSHVLAFAPDQPLPLMDLLAGGPVFRGPWVPLPNPRPLAEAIVSLRLELPPEPDDAVFGEGAEGVGVEPPLPEESGVGAKALSRVQAGVGRGLVGLGRLFGLGGLAKHGANMIQKALERSPGMLQRLTGKQDAAFRWLLQKFQEGRLEEALRRAIPIGDDAGRGLTPTTGAGLPFHNLLYSLASLLGGGSGSGHSYVITPEDVVRQLTEHYRQAAEEAARRGDYRRAAFIYGKLLRDYRAAANALMCGGLHRDAAVLLLMRVGDPLAAARAFAAAGEFDRALELYQQQGDHLAAAELLRQLGEEEAALAEYRMAAEKHTERRDYLAAGDLLLYRARVRTEALAYYRDGWANRPAENAVHCALRLAGCCADAGAADELLRIVDEADEHFAEAGNPTAVGRFYNEIARLAERPPLAALRDDLRDRALLGLTGELRRRARIESRPGTVVSALFSPGVVWPAAQVRDAEYAWKAALKARGAREVPGYPARDATHFRLGEGTVTAACAAPETGEVFVGFDNGAVVSFGPLHGITRRVQSESPLCALPVTSLAVDGAGQMLAVLRSGLGSLSVLRMYVPGEDGHFRKEGETALEPDEAWLSPRIVTDLTGLWDGRRFRLLESTKLIPTGGVSPSDEGAAPTCAVLLPPLRKWGVNVWLVQGQSLAWFHNEQRTAQIRLGWTPAVPTDSSIRLPSLSVCLIDRFHLELAGLSMAGVFNWRRLFVPPGGPVQIEGSGYRQGYPSGTRGYLAAALVRSQFAAAVSACGVDWLRSDGKQVKVVATTRVDLPGAVACFYSPPTNELLVVCQNGHLARVPVPQ